jgi:hypothetical protein
MEGMKRAIVLLLLVSPGALSACQETCIVFEAKRLKGTLKDAEKNPISAAKLIVREARNGDDVQVPCGKKGKIVATIQTGRNGKFDVGALPAGSYWITFMDSDNGESFLVEITRQGGKNLLLHVNRLSGRCYAVDIERMQTKSPGWIKGWDTGKQQN